MMISAVIAKCCTVVLIAIFGGILLQILGTPSDVSGIVDWRIGAIYGVVSAPFLGVAIWNKPWPIASLYIYGGTAVNVLVLRAYCPAEIIAAVSMPVFIMMCGIIFLFLPSVVDDVCGRCSNCGYDKQGAASEHCPECGQLWQVNVHQGGSPDRTRSRRMRLNLSVISVTILNTIFAYTLSVGYRPPDSEESLVRWLDSSDIERSGYAVRHLAQGDPQLLIEAMRSVSPRMRRNAVRAAARGRQSEALGQILLLHEDSDVYVRREVARALRAFPSKESRRILFTLLDDEDMLVRQLAQESSDSF